ncbi:MAG TPA: phosphotransferase [Bacillota bacterium]|nr:phosphotransferase [Bacillota bacterium]
MEKYDINELPLIAEGGEANIYDLGDGKVLRILRNPKGRSFRVEKHLFPFLKEHDICIPSVYEYIENEKMTAMVMQKITGTTMLDQLKRHPFQMIDEIKKFTTMHAQLLSLHSKCKLYSIHEVVNRFAMQAFPIDEKLVDFALNLLKEFPDDDYICHADFHPGNVLIQNNCYYIIDWGAAYHGNYVSDIAHTYLLMTNVPTLTGQRGLQHAVITCIGRIMAKTYLSQMLKLKKFNLSDFSKWTVIMALKRAYYGLPSEKAARIKYINQCHECNIKGIDSATWYKYL